MFKVGDTLEAVDCELPDLKTGDIVEVVQVNPSESDPDFDLLQFEGVKDTHWACRFKRYEGYTNQEMIDRVEKATSLLKNSAPSSVRDYIVGDVIDQEAEDAVRRLIDPDYTPRVSASETQVAGNHYSKLKIQPMEYCLQNDLNYGQSNAIKYITRYKDKNGIEDLKKAIHCIELLIEFEEKE